MLDVGHRMWLSLLLDVTKRQTNAEGGAYVFFIAKAMTTKEKGG
jgi:hypothetical protein